MNLAGSLTLHNAHRTHRHYAPELLAALADSGVMEQQARLLIALAPVSLSLSSGNSGAWGSFEVTVGDWLLSVIR